MDRKIYALGIATAGLLLAAGAWPHAHSSHRDLNGQAGYFWDAGEADQISIAEANLQAVRVSRERKLPRSQVEHLIARSTRNDIYNLSGQVEIDVAELNDRLDGRPE